MGSSDPQSRLCGHKNLAKAPYCVRQYGVPWSDQSSKVYKEFSFNSKLGRRLRRPHTHLKPAAMRRQSGALCVVAISIMCAARGGSWDVCEHVASTTGGPEWLNVIMAGALGNFEAVSRNFPACGIACHEHSTALMPAPFSSRSKMRRGISRRRRA